ncbi:DUF2141 domain-containing protein [Taibaiella koreensis]|uniref:DUF2141 domain-containing protein n=1 Tax=Taibaiella koreensis TaxID=1268548 RepID=UPI0013C2E988|nr:DUF2141 domain-containing protein [Taibaiella koreensis]
MKRFTYKHLLATALFLSTFLFVTAFQTATVTHLKITVTGIKNSKGAINFNLYNKAEGFPKEQAKAFKRLSARITNGTSTVTFENIPFGEYAQAAYHDENGNTRLG